MKKLLILVVFGMGGFVWAEGLVMKDGTVYENVVIVSADPNRMLIVHDGGGCQVAYPDLASGALSAKQRKAIESGLKEYAERKVRLEKIRLEREAFELAQREKGLIEFEGSWMKPVERQEILASRELARLEKERMQVELEKQKAELRKQEVLAERERQLLEDNRHTKLSYSYVYPARHWDWDYDKHHFHKKTPGYNCWNRSSKHWNGRGVGLRISGDGYSFSVGSGSRVHVDHLGRTPRPR